MLARSPALPHELAAVLPGPIDAGDWFEGLEQIRRGVSWALYAGAGVPPVGLAGLFPASCSGTLLAWVIMAPAAASRALGVALWLRRTLRNAGRGRIVLCPVDRRTDTGARLARLSGFQRTEMIRGPFEIWSYDGRTETRS